MAMLTDSDVTDLDAAPYVRSITAPLSPLQARRFAAKFPVSRAQRLRAGRDRRGDRLDGRRRQGHPEKVGAIGRPHPGCRPPARRRRVTCSCARRTRPPASTSGSTPTGSSTPATSPASTTTGSSGSRAGPATSSTAAATRCSPTRWRRCCACRRRSTTSPWSARPTTASARCRSRSSSVDRSPTTSWTALCREHLVAYKVPAAFRWIDELPRSEVGKVLRHELARSVVSAVATLVGARCPPRTFCTPGRSPVAAPRTRGET